MLKKIKLTATQLIIISFASVILVGTFLLWLPISSNIGNNANFLECLFTATSATCVTGLSIKNTAEQWSVFGQIIILILIQIGGLGFMTFLTLVTFFIKRQVSLFSKKIFLQSAGFINFRNIIMVFKRVLFGTFIIEGIGMTLLCFVFVPDFGWKGLYYALFHSVSAFCNAGFDLFGNSLSDYYSNPILNITITALIIIGGLGFIVWSNIIDCRFEFKKFSLHTKIVLIASVILIILPATLYLIFDWNYSLKDMNFLEKISVSFFQTISPRTAGFYTVDLTTMSDSSYILTLLLMFIGGNSGSTAGGIKITTFVVIIFSIFAEAKKNEKIIIGKRKLPSDIAKSASAILTMYFMIIICTCMIICFIEPALCLKEILFEVVSAVCTVGLSLGITAKLCVISQILLIILMFLGRIGSVTFLLAVGEKSENHLIDFATEKIIIG